MSDFIAYAIETSIVAAAFIGGLILLLASVYDVGLIRRRRALAVATRRLRKNQQPHVTVLIYIDEYPNGLLDCLKSIRRIRYHKYDVVIVDNHSSTSVRQTIRKNILAISGQSIYLYAKRKKSKKDEAIHQAYKRSKQGEYIIVLEPNQIIYPQLLKQIVSRFSISESKAALRLNVRATPMLRVVSLSYILLAMSRHTVHKALSSFGHFSKVHLNTGHAYHRSSFVQMPQYQRVAWRYAADIFVANSQENAIATRVQSRSKIQLVGDWTSSALILFFVGILMVVAATMQSSLPLVLSWVIVTFWFTVVLWFDEATALRRKVGLTVCLPASYFIVFAAACVYQGLLIAKIIESQLRIDRT